MHLLSLFDYSTWCQSRRKPPSGWETMLVVMWASQKKKSAVVPHQLVTKTVGGDWPVFFSPSQLSQGTGFCGFWRVSERRSNRTGLRAFWMTLLVFKRNLEVWGLCGPLVCIKPLHLLLSFSPQIFGASSGPWEGVHDQGKRAPSPYEV